MEELELPLRFKEKLDVSDKKFNAIIYDILKNFEDVLNTSTLDFFPEYNNHGIAHLNNVFNIQDELITDESFDLLTVEDITTLVVATLSHDIGMHLNYEGFQTLLGTSEKWQEKWDLFFQKAKKYNQSKLELLFGDSTPVIELPKTKQDFRSRDYMLVGEFLRTNHPVMAEDILNQGFPIANDKFKKLTDLLDDEKKILDFSALLAKSHGMNVRSTFDEIIDIGYQDNLVFAHNVHIVYLMVVLRLSDYMDIYKNRHPKVMLGIKNFMSEISKFEWDKNTAIVDENPYHKDKDAIFIGVEPQDSSTFINLQRLFKGIQYELDISWAVLGEVYSREEDKLKSFAIKYRRIRTNIDDVEFFSKTVDYLPKSISFDSDPELLKLLIAPLYGDDPSYGVRELLQNAVDACKELKELNIIQNYEPKIAVNASKKGSKYIFEIIDNGIGMTESTIVGYFLKAGASFRNSDAWRDNFEDKEHKSKVERTGRFGIGLLASFLIGDKIEVETMHHSQIEGYHFKTKLSDSQINIVKRNNCEKGTTIRIEINEERFDKLESIDWKSWYKLKDVSITFNGKDIEDTINEKQYIELKQDEYTSVYWSFYGERYRYGRLICNGFYIPSGINKLISSIDVPHSSSEDYEDFFHIPSLMIIDKEGKLPLSLSRKELTQKEFGFDDDLIKAMSRTIFNGLLEKSINLGNIIEYPRYRHAIFDSQPFYTRFLYTQSGYNLLNSFSINENRLNKIIFVEFLEISCAPDDLEQILKRRNDFLISLIDSGNNIVLNGDGIVANSSGYSNLLYRLSGGKIQIDKDFIISSAIVHIPKKVHSKVITFKNSYVGMKFKNSLVTSTEKMKKEKDMIPWSEESEFWAKSYIRKQKKSAIDLEKLDDYQDDIGLIMEVEIDYDFSFERKNTEYYFYSLMAEYFKEKDSNWFPYSKEIQIQE